MTIIINEYYMLRCRYCHRHDCVYGIRMQITHWQHPRFHAYFPAGNSYPSILADMLSDAIGCVGFSWVSHSLLYLTFCLSLFKSLLNLIYLFIYLFKNSTQYKQYKIEDTIKAVEF